MRNLSLILAAAIALMATAPLAAAQHNHGNHGASHGAIQTSPADGAMGALPATFSATFEHPMRLTALVITPSRGDPVAVDIPAAAATTTPSVPLPHLAPGNYTFAWTASGADNHTMTGRVRYMVH